MKSASTKGVLKNTASQMLMHSSTLIQNLLFIYFFHPAALILPSTPSLCFCGSALVTNYTHFVTFCASRPCH